MDSEQKICKICGSKMVDQGYNGDWKEYTCSNQECSGSVLEPVSQPSGEGFSMEDLQSISSFND